MKGHASKSVPDRVLKGMILQTILSSIRESGKLLTSQEIHDYISTHTFFFESPELNKYGNAAFSGEYSYNNLPGIRSALSYLKRAGYISLYDRDREGNTIRIEQERPFVWYLTQDGEIGARDTFSKLRIRLDAMEKEIDEKVAHLLSQDEQVEYLAEQKRIEKCKTCKQLNPRKGRLRARVNTVSPYKGRIGIQRKDGTIKDVPVTDEGEIKELEDLKAALVMKGDNPDIPSTIMSLQNENSEMRKVLAEAGIEIGKLAKEKGRKTARTEREFVRQMDRMGIAHYYYENGMYLDAEFFAVWGGSLVVVEYKRLLALDGILNVYYDIQSTKSEIMTRTEYAKRILEAHEIPDVQIEITEIRDGSIVVDSPWFNAPKTLKL